MSRIFGDVLRCVLVAVDHGLLLGAGAAGLADPAATVAELIGVGCEGFVLTAGVARRTVGSFAGRYSPVRVLTIDNYAGQAAEGGNDIVVPVSAAASLGADAVKIALPWNVPGRERRANASLVGRVVGEAERWGLPVMVEVFGGEAEAGDRECQGEACRVASEVGADVVKTAYPGDEDEFGSWCSTLGVPIVVLGGPMTRDADEVVEMTARSVAVGGSGVVIGRNVWNRPDGQAGAILARLRGVVRGTAVEPAVSS